MDDTSFGRNTALPGVDVGGWFPRIGVALFFVIFGLEKFQSGSESTWVRIFAQIGFGQWFRYVTGVIEVGAGLLFLTPAAGAAAVAMAATMVGAILVHCFILGDPGAIVLPLIVLIGVVIVEWMRRARQALTPSPPRADDPAGRLGA